MLEELVLPMPPVSTNTLVRFGEEILREFEPEALQEPTQVSK
jgi:hypothetical protein